MTSLKFTPANRTSIDTAPGPGRGSGTAVTRVAAESGAGRSNTNARIVDGSATVASFVVHRRTRPSLAPPSTIVEGEFLGARQPPPGARPPGRRHDHPRRRPPRARRPDPPHDRAHARRGSGAG